MTITHGQARTRPIPGYGDPEPGGGVFSEGALTLREVLVTANTASAGAGVAGTNSAVISIEQSTISGNSSDLSGGGVFQWGGRLTVTAATISNNTAASSTGSGGIGVGGGTRATVINSTLSGNSGGGMDIDDGAIVTLLSSSIIENSGTWGVSVSGGSLMLQNSVLASRLTRENCYLGLFGSAIVSNGYNLDGGNSCGLKEPGDLVNTDPQLGILRDNGGTTKTHAPRNGSPVIDAGNPAGCMDAEENRLATDQRGADRHTDGNGDSQARCDIGAVEVPGLPTPTPTLTPLPTMTPTPRPTTEPPAASVYLPQALKQAQPTPTQTPTFTNTPIPTVGPTPTPQWIVVNAEDFEGDFGMVQRGAEGRLTM